MLTGLIKSTIATLLLGGCLLAGSTPRGLQKAMEMELPIGCQMEAGEVFSIGTGFPIGLHEVMTAGHVQCEDPANERVKVRGVWLAPLISFIGLTDDVQIIVMDGRVILPKAVTLRDAVIGETTFNSGIAMSGISTTGSVIATRSNIVAAEGYPDMLLTSNPVAGGMSGSAVVGEDGKVLGMTVLAIAGRTGWSQTFWADGAIRAERLRELILAFWKEYYGRDRKAS